MRGRPPTPTHLHILRGNPSKDKHRLNRSEPQPQLEESVPDAPPALSGYAADEWYRVAPELFRLKMLSVLDVQLLGAYCVSYARWRSAEEMLCKMGERDLVSNGLLVKTQGGDAVPNPMINISRRAAHDMISAASHFAMSPMTRARIAAGVGYEPPEGRSKFEGLIG